MTSIVIDRGVRDYLLRVLRPADAGMKKPPAEGRGLA
jgi:hypothetical protein